MGVCTARRSAAWQQVFGLQPGSAVFEHATHGEERSEDDDSISGVCAIDGCAQRLHGVRVHAARGIRARVLRLPGGQQIGPLAARGVGRSVKYQRSISGPMRARMGARSLSAMTPNTPCVVG